MQKWNERPYARTISFVFFPCLSFNMRRVILVWNLWDVFSLCSSNLVSLIRCWFTISMIQQLGRRSSPLIVSGATHTSTQYLSKHLAFTHSSSPSFPSRHPPHITSFSLSTTTTTSTLSIPFFIPGSSWGSLETNVTLMVTDRNIFYQQDPTAWCLWTKIKIKNWTNMSNPVANTIACFKKPT